MMSRTSTSEGMPLSIAAISTVSDLESLSRAMVIKRARVRADGVRFKMPPSTVSARRRRVAHAVTTLRLPRNPRCPSRR